MKKKAFFIAAIISGLLLITNTHLQHPLGDNLFELISLSPWTKANQNGLHLPVILGLVFLLIGIAGTVRLYRPRYPKVQSRVILICIVFVILFPLATEQFMFLLKHNSKGIESVDLLTKNSNCNFQTTENAVKANCSFTILNYGKEGQVSIRPVLEDSNNISFDMITISVSPHTKASFATTFIGSRSNDASYWGQTSNPSFEVEVRGQSKLFE